MSISSIKSYSPQNLKTKPYRRFFAGVLIISTIALPVAMMEWLSVSLTIELSLTALCILFCYACTLHVYQEHADIFHKEVVYKEKIINMMIKAYGQPAPEEKIIMFLESMLELKSTPNVRIEMLQHLMQNPQVVEQMISHLKQEEAQNVVLKDLGLRWNSKD